MKKADLKVPELFRMFAPYFVLLKPVKWHFIAALIFGAIYSAANNLKMPVVREAGLDIDMIQDVWSFFIPESSFYGFNMENSHSNPSSFVRSGQFPGGSPKRPSAASKFCLNFSTV